MSPGSTETPTPPDLALEVDDLPTTVTAEDVVPHIDTGPVDATYACWLPEHTRVVVYRIGNDLYKGKYAATRDEALADAIAVHGRVYEANYVQGRAFFRVPRVK